MQAGAKLVGGHIIEKEIFTVAKNDIGDQEDRALHPSLQGGNDIGAGQEPGDRDLAAKEVILNAMDDDVHPGSLQADDLHPGG